MCIPAKVTRKRPAPASNGLVGGYTAVMSTTTAPGGDDRLDRNWTEILQELRVTQTGVQILSAFLLTVPFSNKFSSLGGSQRAVYLLVLCGSVLTTALVVAPVAFHRILFRRRLRPWLVTAAHGCALAGLFTFALTSSGSLFLVFDVVLSRGPALAVLVGSLVMFGALWAGVALIEMRHAES